MLKLLGLVFCAATTLAGCMTSDYSSDTVEVQQEKSSPDDKFIASSFYCEGGGAAGYSYQNITLRRAGEELNPRDGLLGKHKTWSGFSEIEFRWIDESNLEISYKQHQSPELRDQNSVRIDSKYGIQIHYMVTN